MKHIDRILMSVALGWTVASGCRLTMPGPAEVTPIEHNTIDVSVIWGKLAEYLEHGIIDSRHELAEYVKALRDNGDLQPADLAAFDAAIPNAPRDFSSYSEATRFADSTALRGIP